MATSSSAIPGKIKPHLCLCEWGSADTGEILGDIMIAVENNLSDISALPSALPVMGSLAGTSVRVLAFTDNPGILPAMAEKNITVQLFAKNPADAAGAAGAVMSFALKDIGHLDWENVISLGRGAAGFLFIDDKGMFLHRFYDFLNLADESFDGELHYCAGTNDAAKLEDARRLVMKVRPDLLGNLRLFVTADFFKNLDNGGKSV
ncbi:MAG: hypothetical protein LBL21_03395 [Rickettsiales bacterium]|jgi:hypothetical protein|nr:hypothetical protein [Rickettsiales bacterium]